MNNLFIYMIKAAVYMAAFYAIYSFLLRKDTAYARNRFFILASMALSLSLPLISLHTSKPHDIQFFGKFLSVVLVNATAEKTAGGPDFSLQGMLQLFYSAYAFIVLVFILKFLIDLVNIRVLIFRHKNEGSRIIRFHGFSTSGFSAMGHIFINTRLCPEDAGEIIRHEQNHLNEYHFIDIMFIELVKAFQWFNPAIYLFDRSLRAVHEYQADEGCLNSGIPIANYQSLLLCQVFKSGAFKLTNSFSNPSMIRNRMIMMTKKRTSALASIKLLTVIPVIAFVSFAISAYTGIPDSNTSSKQIAIEMASPPPPPPVPQSDVMKTDPNVQPFTVVEKMPYFPGGEGELMRYIGENTRYPENAKQNNTQGKVIVRFCVAADGSVINISVLKGVTPDLDYEAMRVVSTLPRFKPGTQAGQAVPVWFMVPIAFTLK